MNKNDSKNTKYNELTPEEENVIVNKGTEAPFSGEYDEFFKNGYYVCKRCGTKLFKSDDKFDAHCGWPSFDKAVEGAVLQIPDEDGMRTEIQCTNCKAHLGHVFKGENLTKENTRYCVNSISLKFFPEKAKSTQ
jgi:methionine-R-sulfoxide reductase